MLWVSAIALVVAVVPTSGQMRVTTVTDQHGRVAVALLLRQLDSVGTYLQTTAHPDDENNGLLAALRFGQGMRTVLLTQTRGNGGQNEIGPELFEDLAVLRTEELAAAHRFDGAEQLFGRSIDFGYSFSVDETLRKWGHQEALSDVVRVIRMVRPDVITAFIWGGEGGGQHHQTTSRLTAEAFRAAADPAKFPEQIAEGLRPWQAKKVYALARFGGPGGPGGRSLPPAPAGERTLAVSSAIYDPLLGRTYAEIGAEARSMHKCQGMNQLLLLPGQNPIARYRLIDSVVPGSMDRNESGLFEGVNVTLRDLPSYAGPNPPAALREAVDGIAAEVQAAQKALDTQGDVAAAAPIARGLAATRALRQALGSMGLDDTARYEVGFRLGQKETQFEQALLAAHGVRVEALADDGVVIPGQPITVAISVASRGPEPVAIRQAQVKGVAGGTTCQAGETSGNTAWSCDAKVGIPAGEPVSTPYFTPRTDSKRYDFDPSVPFGAPARPTPFRVAFDLVASGQAIALDVPVSHRYENSLFVGEKRMDLQVVPAFGVTVSPEIAVFPTAAAPTRTQARAAGAAREIRVTVTNGAKGAAQAEVSLGVPAGWKVSPASAPVRFAREDEQVTVRFTVTAPLQAPVGHAVLRAQAIAGGATYGRGVQVVEYPHTSRRHVVRAAEVAVRVLDVKTAPGVTVGYIMGVGDEVPRALEQLGAKVELLDADALAWGDLSRYDVVMTGVRAYERRADLRANNQRLLDYAARGGTVVAHYNKFEFNEAQYGPYPAKVSSNRVTEETAPITLLVPEHPVFNTPNRITDEAWRDWVQERGLYFLGERDETKYVDLLQSEDPYEFNKGVKKGALVEARVGNGRWIYVGLGLWRQLPAGTDGAYKLMANIVSLGKAPVARETAAP
jgi:LmbE family N-acetylglucosaminyl deacetylase